MTNDRYTKTLMGYAALQQIPPLIRSTLLEDMDFLAEYGLATNTVVYVGDFGVAFERSHLYNAIRDILSGTLAKEVTDESGDKWNLVSAGVEGKLPKLELCRDKQNINLPNLLELSPDRTARLNYFDQTVSDVNLSINIRERWRKTILQRALYDEEVDVFQSEILNTPVKQVQLIRGEILSGHCNISSLVPNSRGYFERLVGTFDGSTSIQEYAAGNGRVFLEQLSIWRPYDGFLFSLFVSSHSVLTAEIRVDQLSSEELVHAMNFLENDGDRLSQLGAIEVGLRVIEKIPEIEPIIIRLIEQIRDDVVDGQNSGFKLFSTLFILVDGELSRIKLFSSEPPFYRRLVSLSQAALIYRQLINSRIDTNLFCEWALSNRVEQYYLQSLVDMRTEPRWNPDLVEASQTKTNFLSRIIGAFINYKQNIKNKKLSGLVFSIMGQSQHSLSKFLLPGPLEGIELTQYVLSDKFSKVIETQLNAEKISPLSFIALVNSARIFGVSAKHAELAARAIKINDYQIDNLENRAQLLNILNGLATVAAVARSRMLADELRILVRRYKYDAQYDLSIEEVVRICVEAASSRADLDGWRDFIGDWLTELAFGELMDNDGKLFYYHLRCLCQIVPELWITCARAEAALTAYNLRN